MIELSENIDKIADAIHQAQANFTIVRKTGKNTHHKYDYAMLNDYIAVAKPVLAKFGLSLITSVDKVERSDHNQKNVIVHLTILILHQSGQWIRATGVGEGSDAQDKASYKAITGGRKYLIASALGLSTSDDPEGSDPGGSDDLDFYPAGPILKHFAPFGIGQEQIEKYLNVKIGAGITGADKGRLTGIFRKLKDGTLKPETAFGSSGAEKPAIEGVTLGEPPTNPRATVASSVQPKQPKPKGAKGG